VKEKNDMESIVLKTPGISCSHCEAAIKKAVGALPGAGQVKVDLASKLVTVDYDGRAVNPADIRAAIEDQGYEVVAP
jgi:copper chaperone